MALNDQIQAYLAQANIAHGAGDYMTGQPEGQPDQILHWDAKLGPQPTQEQLDTAYAAYQQTLQAEKNKAKAVQLLNETDWTQHADVNNAAVKPYLTNQTAFNSYRAALRSIAVNPPTEPITSWPVLPTEEWST
jgi:hypothetical protein